MPRIHNNIARITRTMTCPSLAPPVPANACPHKRLKSVRSNPKRKIFFAFMA
jgi:hypothetical protein